MKFKSFFPIVLALAGTQAFSDTISFRTIFWNMESGGASLSTLERQIAQKSKVSLWGLSEVEGQSDLSRFEAASETKPGQDFQSILSSTGCSDRLGVMFDKAVFELIDSFELSALNFGNDCHRAPLVGHFKIKDTDIEFYYVVNHLARGNAGLRLKQTEGLSDWAQTHAVPTILGGDLNADFHITEGDSGNRDAAFDAMIVSGPFTWIRPARLLKTEDNDRYMTVLDFVMVANMPASWSAVSTILQREGDSAAVSVDFDDDNQQTDHRPVDTILTIR